jgi:hypothetical protein
VAWAESLNKNLVPARGDLGPQEREREVARVRLGEGRA